MSLFDRRVTFTTSGRSALLSQRPLKDSLSIQKVQQFVNSKIRQQKNPLNFKVWNLQVNLLAKKAGIKWKFEPFSNCQLPTRLLRMKAIDMSFSLHWFLFLALFPLGASTKRFVRRISCSVLGCHNYHKMKLLSSGGLLTMIVFRVSLVINFDFIADLKLANRLSSIASLDEIPANHRSWPNSKSWSRRETFKVQIPNKQSLWDILTKIC